MNRTLLGRLLLVLAVAPAGCALTGKSDLVIIHYYSPEAASRKAGVRAQAPKESGAPLRLGRVASGSHLEDKIAVRSSEHEIGFYDQHRWTEEPAEYLERALARELFEGRGLPRSVSGSAPTLQVELVAFEEVKVPRHVARVQLILVLHDEKKVGLQETLTFEKPLRDEVTMDALASALGAAMTEAVRAVAAVIPLVSASALRKFPHWPGLAAARVSGG